MAVYGMVGLPKNIINNQSEAIICCNSAPF